MEETKKLKISSPDDLYTILNSNQTLAYEDSGLASFFDFMQLAKNGCKCRAQAHYEEAYRIYYSLPNAVSSRIISSIKINYKVDILSFFDKEKHLFDL